MLVNLVSSPAYETLTDFSAKSVKIEDRVVVVDCEPLTYRIKLSLVETIMLIDKEDVTILMVVARTDRFTYRGDGLFVADERSQT